MGKNSNKKNNVAVVESELLTDTGTTSLLAQIDTANAAQPTQLPDPPAEIILDVNPKTEEKENTMETTKPVRADLVALATELNSFLTDCKISTKKAIADEVITAQIMSHTFELVWTDFVKVEETDVILSDTSIETLVALGFEVPKAPVAKADKLAKTKKTSSAYTRQLAFVDALKASGGTSKELAVATDKLYRAASPLEVEATDKKLACDLFCCSKMITATLPILVALGSIEYNAETKVYSLPVELQEDAEEVAEV